MLRYVHHAPKGASGRSYLPAKKYGERPSACQQWRTTSASALGRVKTALKGVGFAIQNRLGLRPRSRPSAAWSR